MSIIDVNGRQWKEFKSFYKDVGGNEGSKCHYPIRMDSYGCGCAHDCKYCYAKSLLDFRKLWNAQEPSVVDVAKMRKVVSRIPPGTPAIRLGGMTDCFQPIEKLHRVTYEAIKALNARRQPYLIVTKSHIVADPEYLEILDRDLAHIQVTITSTDDALAARYEKASPPSKRIDAVERLQAEGFDVAVRLSPFIPEFVDVDVLNAIKCDKVQVEFLRVNGWIQKWFGDMVDFSEYTIKQSGYRHLPLEKKKQLIAGVHFKQVSVCEDETEAYEYWKNHFNPNPDDCCNLRK